MTAHRGHRIVQHSLLYNGALTCTKKRKGTIIQEGMLYSPGPRPSRPRESTHKRGKTNLSHGLNPAYVPEGAARTIRHFGETGLNDRKSYIRQGRGNNPTLWDPLPGLPDAGHIRQPGYNNQKSANTYQGVFFRSLSNSYILTTAD